MNKKMAIEWLKAAYLDIQSIEYVIKQDYLTPIASFHAHQAIEKSFKAIIEYQNKKIPKTHDLLSLKDRINNILSIENEEILEKLNELYIDSRYPSDFGLLPYGKPTLKDAQEFYNFAKEIFYKVCEILDVKEDDFGTR